MEMITPIVEHDIAFSHKRRKLIDWDSVHDIVKRLYKDKGRNLSDTMRILPVRYGFEASYAIPALH